MAHLTSAHSRYDTRIFIKMCGSLVSSGNGAALVVADGGGDEVVDGVTIYDVGSFNGRLDRIRHAPAKVLTRALALNADVYHLHDPELLPVGLKLKRHDKAVIFDAHEDAPRQMLSKPYLSRPVRWCMAQALRIYETIACSRFDGVVAATPHIRDKFLKINPVALDINNYPLLGELYSASPWSKRDCEVCYVGGISDIRGIKEVCVAMALLESDVRLNLAGRFSDLSLEARSRASEGWQHVDHLGFVGREKVRDVLARSMAGIVTFHPLPNHIDAQPNKMFEYMSAGIPVIGSDFPLWREIIGGNECGLLVDPLDPTSIAAAIETLVKNPDLARRMGENGRKAVERKYNWHAEERKLLSFYEAVVTSNLE